MLQNTEHLGKSKQTFWLESNVNRREGWVEYTSENWGNSRHHQQFINLVLICPVLCIPSSNNAWWWWECKEGALLHCVLQKPKSMHFGLYSPLYLGSQLSLLIGNGEHEWWCGVWRGQDGNIIYVFLASQGQVMGLVIVHLHWQFD